jgi:hypothetical protein
LPRHGLFLLRVIGQVLGMLRRRPIAAKRRELRAQLIGGQVGAVARRAGLLSP